MSFEGDCENGGHYPYRLRLWPLAMFQLREASRADRQSIGDTRTTSPDSGMRGIHSQATSLEFQNASLSAGMEDRKIRTCSKPGGEVGNPVWAQPNQANERCLDWTEPRSLLSLRISRVLERLPCRLQACNLRVAKCKRRLQTVEHTYDNFHPSFLAEGSYTIYSTCQ